MTEANGPLDRNQHQLPPELEEGPPGFVFYRGSIPFEELPFPEEGDGEDYDWACENPELHRQYQGLVVAVHGRKVWGVGKDGDAALEEALHRPDCPPAADLALVLMVGMPSSP